MEFAISILFSLLSILVNVPAIKQPIRKQNTYMAIDTANAIMLTVTVSETGLLKRRYKKTVTNNRIPAGTSIFICTVAKCKTADKAINSGIADKSKTFSFKRDSLAYVYKTHIRIEVYLINDSIKSFIKVLYNKISKISIISPKILQAFPFYNQRKKGGHTYMWNFFKSVWSWYRYLLGI